MRYNGPVNLRKLTKALLWTAFLLGIVGVALRLLLVRTWTVPSDDSALSASIAPTLAPDDFVVLLHAVAPGFGDLVRCTDPDEPRRWVIARIVGEGGDSIEINQGRLIINGQSAPLEHACLEPQIQVPDPNTGSPVELRCDMENLSGTVHPRASGVRENFSVAAPVKRRVPPGFFYLVSDNRFNHFDSRIYGAVPVETCDTRIILRLWGVKGLGDTDTRMTWIN